MNKLGTTTPGTVIFKRIHLKIVSILLNHDRVVLKGSIEIGSFLNSINENFQYD